MDSAESLAEGAFEMEFDDCGDGETTRVCALMTHGQTQSEMSKAYRREVHAVVSEHHIEEGFSRAEYERSSRREGKRDKKEVELLDMEAFVSRALLRKDSSPKSVANLAMSQDAWSAWHALAGCTPGIAS
eukprot:751543-Hanusia_phi.AAC.2